MGLLQRLGLSRIETTDDYPGALVPLSRAHHYSASAKKDNRGGQGYDALPEEDAEEDIEETKDNGDNEAAGMLHGGKTSEYSIAGLRKEMREGRQGKWTSNEIKSKLINKALADIGMGRYNWQLFILCGFGWFADNLWIQGASLTLPSLSGEFGIDEKTIRYTTSVLFLGLSLGSSCWGIGSDYVGRRLPFNVTLLIASIFGIATGYQQSWGAVSFCLAAMGTGVGGSLPVDGSLFLEFLPGASGALLTLMSVWWPIGQLVSSLVAWFFISNWPVEQGWRYFVVTIGVITFGMFAIRFFIFRLLESPKYLLNQGRDEEAVAVIHGLAFRNRTCTWLTLEILRQVAGDDDDDDEDFDEHELKVQPAQSALRAKLQFLSSDKMSELFKDKKTGITTALIWFAWTTIGMGYPLFAAFLPQFFARSASSGDATLQDETAPISGDTYRSYAISSIFGVPGSLLAAYLVDHPSPFFGRRGTLAISTFISALFQFLFVQFGKTSTAQLIFSCVISLSQNALFATLYTYSPEVFSSSVRGTGTGVASFLNRVAGLLAPIFAAIVPGDATAVPVYLSTVLIFLAFISVCCIPIETRGAQRL